MTRRKRGGTIRRHHEVKNLKSRSRSLPSKINNKMRESIRNELIMLVSIHEDFLGKMTRPVEVGNKMRILHSIHLQDVSSTRVPKNFRQPRSVAGTTGS